MVNGPTRYGLILGVLTLQSALMGMKHIIAQMILLMVMKQLCWQRSTQILAYVRKNAVKSGMVQAAVGWKARMFTTLETIIIFLRQRVEPLSIIWRQQRAAKTFMAHMKIAHTIRFSPIKMIQQSKFSVQVMLIWWTMKMEIGGWFIWEHDRY